MVQKSLTDSFCETIRQFQEFADVSHGDFPTVILVLLAQIIYTQAAIPMFIHSSVHIHKSVNIQWCFLETHQWLD